MSVTLTPSQRAERQQRIASDPMLSAWVGASAGSGKTKVLTDRVLRLLLQDNQAPNRLLCLTFTKAAAAEMQTRLAKRLGQWACADDADGFHLQLLRSSCRRSRPRPRASHSLPARRAAPLRCRARAGRHNRHRPRSG